MDIAHNLKMLFVALAVCLAALAVGAGIAWVTYTPADCYSTDPLSGATYWTC